MTLDQVMTPPDTSKSNSNTWDEKSMLFSPPVSDNTTNIPVVAPQTDIPIVEKSFWAYENNTPETNTLRLKKRFSMSIQWAVLWITISLIIGGVFLFLAKVNIWSTEKDPNYSNVVQTYKDFIISIDQTLGYPWITKYQAMVNSIDNTSIKETIDSAIPFIFKQDILEETVTKLVSSILSKSKSLQDVTKDITKYGFIHPDVMWLLEKNKEQIPIMVSLHTLETIKFWTAIKIFSMLDTFLQQASQSLWISKEQLSWLMDSYSKRGEKDIANYLSMCYLNPYEKLPNCDQINDFNNYFVYEDKESDLDTSFFWKIFALIDSKLEKSDIASLQIDFNRFDPNVKNIGFRVTVNTLAEDDTAFMARWILNPHIFIISTLVTLLKQSFFVIWDSINVDKLNIKQQNITVWNIQIPVNTSFMTFDLPLQNSSEREIFDFYDNR
jgi:hypothetical protein